MTFHQALPQPAFREGERKRRFSAWPPEGGKREQGCVDNYFSAGAGAGVSSASSGPYASTSVNASGWEGFADSTRRARALTGASSFQEVTLVDFSEGVVLKVFSASTFLSLP